MAKILNTDEVLHGGNAKGSMKAVFVDQWMETQRAVESYFEILLSDKK